MRVGLIALIQESNTFIDSETELEHFRKDIHTIGDEVRKQFLHSHHEVSGFFAGLAAERIEAVPIFAARAMPHGPIAADVFALFMQQIIRALDHAGPLDGVLAAIHGATVSQSFKDADGHLLGMVRRHIGDDVPMIATMDPHGNLSYAMVNACNAIIAYRTNPHLDQFDRGVEAATLMAATLCGNVRPTPAAIMPPLAISIDQQDTAAKACEGIYTLAEEIRNRPGVLSSSIVLGFPYADVPEMGAACVVVTDADAAGAERYANELAMKMWSQRDAFVADSISVEQALAAAIARDGPVCLLDQGDNVGGGAPGDGTAILHAIAAQNLCPAVACICDSQSVHVCKTAGVGADVQLQVGGKSRVEYGPPLELHCRVKGIYDGRFDEPAITHGGFQTFDQGPTAVVETQVGLCIVLISQRTAPFSLRQLTAFGIEPGRFKLFIAKGVHAPVAAYRKVCRHFIRVDTPGVTQVDMTRLRYDERRRPMFPFELETQWP